MTPRNASGWVLLILYTQLMKRIIDLPAFGCLQSAETEQLPELFCSVAESVLMLNFSEKNRAMRSTVFSRTYLELQLMLDEEGTKKNNAVRLHYIRELMHLITSQIRLSKVLIAPDEKECPPPEECLERGRFHPLEWTGTQTEWVELVKALHLHGCFNHGALSFKDLFETLSHYVNIGVEHPHNVYAKMRTTRAGDRTLFLSSLIRAVEKDMAEKDER